MYASCSLRAKAEEEISKGSSFFKFGNVLYMLSDFMPKEKVLNFFVITKEGKDFFVYVLPDSEKEGDHTSES